jgi:hypothetical protein
MTAVLTFFLQKNEGILTREVPFSCLMVMP